MASGLAVIVISVRANPQLADAVGSIGHQEGVEEIVVVNSGGGNAASLVPTTNCRIKVTEFADVLSPGAARNKGLEATLSPFVAFLADDCLATTGWAAARLGAHRDGIAAVGSALLNDRRHSPVAWAAHISRFLRRLPNAPAQEALPYGASYDRSLFIEYGHFREDLRTGEDTEFHGRLPAEKRPTWCPSVQTIHRSTPGLFLNVREQFHRGKRYALVQRQLRGHTSFRTAAAAIRVTFQTMIRGLAWVEGRDKPYVLLAWPLIALFNTVFTVGTLAGRRR